MWSLLQYKDCVPILVYVVKIDLIFSIQTLLLEYILPRILLCVTDREKKPKFGSYVSMVIIDCSGSWNLGNHALASIYFPAPLSNVSKSGNEWLVHQIDTPKHVMY